MSKVFLIGDTHLGMGYPNKTDKWFKIHMEYFDNFLFPLLESRISDGDRIVHLGDFFDNRNVIPINILNYGMDIIERLSKVAPTHIIIGNHDLYTKSTGDINTVRIYKHIPNVFIYDKATSVDFDGVRILMLPFIEKRLDQINQMKDNLDHEYLFCHSDLNGSKMHLTSVAHNNPDKIGIDDFTEFKKVYSGHIHIVQSQKNFTFAGSIFQMDRNDIDDQKGIFVIDLENGSEEFIPNNISPVFRKIYLRSEEDVDILDSLVNTKDYIDLIISNSLLMGNRKMRRKLEITLESGNFSSVEYLDDILKEPKEPKEGEGLDELMDISVHLDYEEYIKKYILDQKYDSEKIKMGILSEFGEIVKIYNENYRGTI